MDFHSMKRKQLQALCKQHKIPANLSNLDMANKLTEFLKEKEDPVIHEEEGIVKEEAESDDVGVNKKVKKVRFSPEHELIEFTRLQEPKRRRRKSLRRADSNWPVEIVESGEVNETEGRRGRSRVTRVGELKVMEEEIIQKGGTKETEGNGPVEIVGSGEVNKETEGRRGRSRSTRSGESKVMEEEMTQKKRGKASVKCNDGKANSSAVEIIDDDKLEEGDVVEPGRVTRLRGKKMEAQGVKNTSTREKKGADNKQDERVSSEVNNEKDAETLSRVTRSRAQKLTETPAEVNKRGRRVVKNIGNVAAVGAEAVDNEESGAYSLSKKGDESEGMQENGEGLKENLMNKQIAEEHVIVDPPRRSKRKADMVGNSEMFGNNPKKHENGAIRDPIKTSKLLPLDGSQMDANVTERVVNTGRGTRAVHRIEEHIKKVEPRRSNRRKTVIESDVLKAETENRSSSRISVQLSDVPEISKDEKMILQPTGVTRRGRRKTLGLKLCPAKDTVSIEKPEAVKHVSEPCLVGRENSAIEKSARTRSTSACKPPGKFTDEANMLDTLSHCSSEEGQSLFLDVQLPVKKNTESGCNLGTKDIIADEAGGYCADLINGEEPERNSTSDEDQNCKISEVEKGNSQLGFYPQQSTEKDIANAETQVNSQMEDSVCINEFNNQVVVDGSDVSEKEGSDETCSSSDSLLLIDQIDVKTALKVTEIEKDEGSQPCTGVVDHHNDLKHLEASNNILDSNNEDASQTAGEVGIYVSYGSTKLKGSSSSMTRPHGDNVAEENETLSHKGTKEMAVADEDGSSNDCENISNHISEFNVLGLVNGKTCEGESSKGHVSTCVDEEFSLANLFDTEGTCGIIPQDRKKFSSETRKGESSGGHMNKCEEDGELTLAYLFDAEGKYGITPQERKKFPGETHEGDSSEAHRIKCDEDGEFRFANLFDAEGRYDITPQDKENFSGEHLVTDFDGQGNSFTSVELRDHEKTLSVGGKSNYKDKMSESTEADESGCLEGHKSSNDDDWGFSGSNPRDGDKNTRIEPHDLPSVSKVEDLDEQRLSPVLPAVSTVLVNYNGVKFGTDGSNSQETNPSTPSSISVTQADEQKSQSAKSSNLVKSNHHLAASSNAHEPEGNEVCFSKSYDAGKICLVTEDFSADEDDKDDYAGNSNSKYCPISSSESPIDMKFQDLVETEHQNKDSLSRLTKLHAGEEATHATQRKSWAEIALHNLFGTPLDRDASPGLDDTFCEGSEIENMTISKNKLITNNDGSLTRQKGKEMEGDNRNECAEAKYKDMVSPTSCKDDTYENELKYLFATPVKIVTPCKIEEAHPHDRVLDSSVTSTTHCFDKMKENVATDTMPDKNTQNSGYEVETSSCIGVLLSDNGGDDICKEIKEVEIFSSHNTSNGLFPEHRYDGRKVLQDQLAHKKEEFLKETNLVAGEDKEENFISLAESCLHIEATEKTIIGSSCSTWDLFELESRADMSETEGEMIQNTEVVVESYATDLQKSNVPENSHLLTAGSDDDIIMREISVDASSDPEEAKIGRFQKDVMDKGESLFLFSKASPDCEDSIRETGNQYEAKTLDEKDDIPKLSQYISDELMNSGVAIQNSVAIGHSPCQEMDQLPSSDELEDTYKEAKGMGTTSRIQYTIDAVAEHESCVSGAVSVFLSSSAMPAFLEYQENGDTNIESEVLSDDGGDGTCEEMNNVEIVKVEDSSTTVLSKAFEEQLTENSGECEQETDFMNEDKEKNVNSLRKSCLSDKGTNSGSKFAEETTISLSGSPNILDKLKGCPDMLIDTSLSESLSYSCSVNHKSEQKMAQSSEVTLEFSDANNQKINHLTGWFADMHEETPFHTCPLVAEFVNVNSFDSQSADKGTSLHHSSNVSPVNDKLTQREDTDDLNGVEICDEMDAKAESSKDMMSDEPQINNAVEILKTLPDTDNLCEEADKLPCSVELESAFLEAKETDSTVQDVNTVVAPTDLPVSGFNDILKESDVADTIKEYIESESSMSTIFENTASLSSDIDAHTCENSALSKYEDGTAGRVANSKNEDNNTLSVDCFETEIKEQEKASSFIEPAQVSGNAANSAGCVGLFNKGSVKLDSQKMVGSETGRSTMKKNARTILIHGTPNKLLTMTDMKENAPTQKNSNIGDVTAARPAKRRALQKVPWK